MKKLLFAALVLTTSSGWAVAQENPARESAAVTYEHLAKVIIELRATETNLVKTILRDYAFVANHHLEMAAKGMDVATNLEGAASEITKIANEGDKAILAVRQRLVAAGHHHHHHHSDAETQEDYIFVDQDEKKAMLDLAGRVARLGGSAKSDAVTKLKDEFNKAFDAALAEE